MKPEVKKVKTLTGHQGSVYTILEGWKLGELISAGSEKFVARWAFESSEDAEILARSVGVVYSLLYLETQNILLLGNDQGGIHVIDLTLGQEVRYLFAHTKGIFDLKLHPTKTFVYAAGGDGKLSCWNYLTWDCVFETQLCDAKLRQIQISPDLKSLAVACGDSYIRLLSNEDFHVISEIQAHKSSVNSLCFSPDGRHLISGGKDAMLEFRSYPEMELLKSIPAHNFAIYSIVFHPEGKWFATGSRDKTIKIWDPIAFEFLLRIDREHFDGHVNSVNKLVWLKHKNYLASAGDDRSVMIWEVN